MVGSRRGPLGQIYVEAVACQDFGHCSRKVFRLEPLVIPYNYPLSLSPLFEQVGGKSLGTAADIVERIIFGDHAPPPIRAEL